ncbi:hypothetical protein EVAR_100039_1 [Eumeta japonica]|uniref:Uncharacterized protein n=1 Tax=Eumeta variegata TaxID=151549 RepID=A0A4C1T7Q3_EUMVA|nr:hypothetical protein EVAR_100039_1 [Eumeta japonica]
MLWTTCLQYKNRSATPVKYHILTEYRRDITTPDINFRPVIESSDGPLSSITPLPYTSRPFLSLSLFRRLSNILHEGRQRVGGSSEIARCYGSPRVDVTICFW